jgi:hypothetical protein
MAISAITPSVSKAGRVEVFDGHGRFSCGQERLVYVGRVGSFADGQSLRASDVAFVGRFSGGQERTPMTAGVGREGSFADGMLHLV